MKNNNKRKRRNKLIKKLVSKLLYAIFVIGFFTLVDLLLVEMVASLFE